MILRKRDYVAILNRYGLPIPANRNQLKRAADQILEKKFCKCFAKLRPMYGNRAIGACTRSIYNLQRYTRKLRFRCLSNGRFVNYEPTTSRRSRRIRTRRRRRRL